MITRFEWTCEIEGVFDMNEDPEPIYQAYRNQTPIDLGVGRDVVITRLDLGRGGGRGAEYSITAGEAVIFRKYQL